MIQPSSQIDKIISAIFDPDIELSESEDRIKARYDYLIKALLIKPYIKVVQLIALEEKEFGISRQHAWRDYEAIKDKLGCVKDMGKEFYRYFATEMIKDAVQQIEKADNPFLLKKAEALLKASDTLARVQNLDKDEIEKLRWDEIQTFLPEPTTDVTVLGKRPIKDMESVKLKILAKYQPQTQDAQIIDED